jgi:hypothetical protein
MKAFAMLTRTNVMMPAQQLAAFVRVQSYSPLCTSGSREGYDLSRQTYFCYLLDGKAEERCPLRVNALEYNKQT